MTEEREKLERETEEEQGVKGEEVVVVEEEKLACENSAFDYRSLSS